MWSQPQESAQVLTVGQRTRGKEGETQEAHLAPQVTPLQGGVLGALIRGKLLCPPLKDFLEVPSAVGSPIMLIAMDISSLWFKMIIVPSRWN